ncbi:MAG: PilN domain-containing protein [Deltaproteobacteria bacterium]|nr:PilN domain-containing protein [Deltaproteobacteria bacterium]
MAETILGLNIEDREIQAVVIRPGLSTAVEAYTTEPVDAEGGFEPALDRVLDRVGRSVDTRNMACHAAFGSSGISFRRLSLPFSEPRKIRQVLDYELESMLPDRAEAILSDCHILEKGEKTRCIAAACRKELVGVRVAALKAHGLSPTVLTADGAAAALVFLEAAQPEGPGVFLSLSASGVVAVLYEGKSLVAVRNMEGTYARAPERLCGEIRIFCRAQEATGREFAPETAVLAGPGARDWVGLPAALAENLSVEVKTLDLAAAAGVEVPDELKGGWEPAKLDRALALALHRPTQAKGFNLLQGPYAVKEKWREYQGVFVRAAVLAGILLLALFARFLVQTHVLQARMDRLDAQMAAVYRQAVNDPSPVQDPLAELAARTRSLQQALSLPGEEAEPPVKVVDVLRAVTESIPKGTDVTVTSFIVSRDQVQIGGDTDGFDSVNTIKAGLDTVEFMDNVTIVRSDQMRKENRVRFRIKARLKGNA